MLINVNPKMAIVKSKAAKIGIIPVSHSLKIADEKDNATPMSGKRKIRRIPVNATNKNNVFRNEIL